VAKWLVSGWRSVVDDEVAVAEDRDAGDDDEQGQRLAGQVRNPGLDVLAEQDEQEQSQQAGRG
jgi:hypothetical protein